jgi:FdrA protein
LRSGSIGLVGASGTGLQEVSCQIHRRGFGISHMLGTGGRDLSIEIGGISTLAAIDMLAADPNTSILVIVSKPPAPEVAQKVVEHLASLNKPSVVIFLGDKPQLAPQGKIHFAAHLSDAAWIACRLAAGEEVIPYSFMDQQNSIAPLARDMNREQHFLHGLFSGGTLGAEALLLLRERLGAIMSNLDHATKYNTENPACHTLTDLGDDEFTRGRPHPMIDPTLRAEWIVRLGQLPSTAILLLDLVLGTGCHPNPAQIVADAVHQASAKNPGLVAIASITGTELDSQDLNRQQMTLQQAGIVLCPSNIDAANFAAGLLSAKENG